MSDATVVQIQQMSHADGLPLPSYETAGAAGADLAAAIPTAEPLIIMRGNRALVPTGLRLALPFGHEAQIRPRSGLASKFGVTVLNTPGTIDADYRGELKVLLVNLGDAPFEVTRGMRIAQLIVAPVTQALFEVRDDLDDTARGTSGFGSTGTG